MAIWHIFILLIRLSDHKTLKRGKLHPVVEEVFRSFTYLFFKNHLSMLDILRQQRRILLAGAPADRKWSLLVGSLFIPLSSPLDSFLSGCYIRGASGRNGIFCWLVWSTCWPISLTFGYWRSIWHPWFISHRPLYLYVLSFISVLLVRQMSDEPSLVRFDWHQMAQSELWTL